MVKYGSHIYAQIATEQNAKSTKMRKQFQMQSHFLVWKSIKGTAGIVAKMWTTLIFSYYLKFLQVSKFLQTSSSQYLFKFAFTDILLIENSLNSSNRFIQLNVLDSHPHNNPFYVTALPLYPLKSFKSFCFSDVFRGYRKRPVTWNGLIVFYFSWKQ